MIKLLIALAVFLGICNIPSKKSQPKKELKFAKDFEMPNQTLDYSMYD